MIEELENVQYIYTYTRNGVEFVTPSLKVASNRVSEGEEIFYQEISFHE